MKECAALAFAALLGWSASVASAEIKVLSGNGARAAITELSAQFERASGHKVSLQFAVNPEAKRRIEAGEAFDVAILNPPVLDDLIRQGRISADTRAVLGRSGIGVGARDGAPKPDISSVAAFKRTLLDAKSVAYPGEGASGKYFVGLIEKLGLASEMKSKMRPMPAEYNVEAVARGEVELVVAVASRISGVPGVQLVGRIPQELQTWIGFNGGVATTARQPEAARALLRFFTAPPAADALRAIGVEPFIDASPPVLGLDHIPVAVKDLGAAAERYRQLGFTLKPGRPHENGIRNEHAKFADGTEIELITADRARDGLTSRYLAHLASGDGPAFAAFFAPDLNAVARQEGDLRYIFFGPRNHSPTDRPEHFRHSNGAEALIGVWVAGDDLSGERELLARMGASISEEELHFPGTAKATVARLPQAEVVFLPGSLQQVPGRRIVGATLRTRNLESLQRVLAQGSWTAPAVVRTRSGRSLFLPPDLTHGIWLEFREFRD